MTLTTKSISQQSSCSPKHDEILAEFTSYLHSEFQSNWKTYRSRAHHFLIWLQISEIALETIDSTVIEQFLQHECSCRAMAPPQARFGVWRKCHGCSYLMTFIRFLEQIGQVKTPGDLEENISLLKRYLNHLRDLGYASSTVESYRSSCMGLVAWLHLRRIRLKDLTLDVIKQFRNKRLVCFIPEVFSPNATRRSDIPQNRHIDNFLAYLVEIERIEPLQSPDVKKSQPVILERFRSWLELVRNVSSNTASQYAWWIAKLLPQLGENPQTYDTCLIREVFETQMLKLSPSQIKSMVKVLRMYLRFVVTEYHVPANLMKALPETVPQWRFSNLPRYISDEDTEKTIASCSQIDNGVRDRAILLLLSRLALRAGDVTDLRLSDIDWERAQIRVSGKSKRQAILPLPQDVGDALYAYISEVRPKVSESQVFLTSKAPYRPFAGSGAISHIATRAFNRAEVTTFANRGAHVFRHSRATNLLRNGASLDTIQSLLRHESADTSMIYAKTDIVMLEEIAQPWIGRTDQ